MPNLYTSTWFILTEQHLTLFRKLNIVYYNLGGFGTDRIRPFGDSDIERNMQEILELPLSNPDGEVEPGIQKELQQLYDELAFVMQIVIHTGTLQTGMYHREDAVVNNWSLYPLNRTTPIPTLSPIARDILMLLLWAKEENDMSYMAKWDIADMFGVSSSEFSSQLPELGYDAAIKQLLEAKLIEEHLEYRYRLVGLPEEDD